MMNVRLTVFDRPLATPPVPGVSRLVDWDTVVARIRKPHPWPGDPDDEAGKDRLPGWSFSLWENDDKRKREPKEREGKSKHWPAIEVSGLALDYDDDPDVSKETIRKWWGRWTYAAHTTSSHLRTKGDKPAGPRWRVFLPFSRTVTPEELVLIGIWARHAKRGAGILGDECMHPRRWYFRPAKRGAFYEYDANAGESLDPDACLAELTEWEPPLPEPVQAAIPLRPAPVDDDGDLMQRRRLANAGGALRGAVARIRAVPAGERHAKVLSEASVLGGYVVSGLLDRETVATDLIAAGIEVGKDPAEMRRTVYDGLEYGKDTPRGMVLTDRHGWMPQRRSTDPGPEPELLLYRADVVARLLCRTYGRIVYWRAQHYLYTEGCYRAITDAELSALIVTMVEARGKWARVAKTKEEKAQAFALEAWPDVQVVARTVVATSNDVREVLLQLRIDLVPAVADAPCWLDGLADQPPPQELLCCDNGLCHPITDTLIPHSSSYFGLGRVGYSYDPAATAPTWMGFVVDLFGEDVEALQALQELMGYYLFPDTSQHKIGLIVGPKRAGKGTVARVLRALLGSLNVAGPTLSSLATDFGLWPLIERRLAIISDARLGYGVNGSAIVERLLAVSGEDAITVDRKYLTPWTGTLPTRFLVLTNELPRLGDASGALVSRFLLIQLQRSWYGQEDTALTERLLAELPGILVWAIEGYRRLIVRGRFVQPQSALDTLQELEDLSSPMTTFLRDWCEREDETTPIATLYEGWCVFCEENGREHPGTVQGFSRDMRAALPDLPIKRTGTDGPRPRSVAGLRLTFAARRKVQDAQQEEAERRGRRDRY